ncbi:gliding motility protein GldN [Bacteroidota bacterium]
MKKSILLFVFISSLFLTSNEIKSQFVNDGVYNKENIRDRNPVPYPSLREADMMWSRRVWRIVDLRHKMNHPMFYPTTPIGDRMSLFDLILWGVKNEGLQAYSAQDDEFKIPIGLDQIKKAFDATPDTTEVINIETGEPEQRIIEREINSTDVRQYLIKEEWYFERKYSQLQVRIIGLCPIRVWEEEDADGDFVTKKQMTFWVYFPEARRIFANHEVYNPNNEAQRLSYDDLFMQRLFDSYIQKTSNVYNNRLITEYTSGLHAILESEEKEREIFYFEHDLWEY